MNPGERGLLPMVACGVVSQLCTNTREQDLLALALKDWYMICWRRYPLAKEMVAAHMYRDKRQLEEMYRA